MSFHEKTKRSVTKALTYRALILCSDSIVVYFLTKRLDLTIGFVTASNIISTLIYFFHERAWNNIRWGRIHSKPKIKK